jgi:hypothetical protein
MEFAGRGTRITRFLCPSSNQILGRRVLFVGFQHPENHIHEVLVYSLVTRPRLPLERFAGGFGTMCDLKAELGPFFDKICVHKFGVLFGEIGQDEPRQNLFATLFSNGPAAFFRLVPDLLGRFPILGCEGQVEVFEAVSNEF